MSSSASLRNRVTPQGQQVTPAFFCCNRCERPLATSLFVCGCFCVFCEECTIDHFQKSHNCPSCGRALTDNDFMNLVITDPSPGSESVKPMFQKLFTKKSLSSQNLQLGDMSSQFLRQWNDLNMVGKFLLKQLVEYSNKQGQDKGSLRRANEVLQQENVQLKQSQSAERMELQKTADDLHLQLQARNATIAELHLQLDQKENMISKFRKLHGNRLMAGGPLAGTTSTTIPVSSHSDRSVYQNRTQRGEEPPHRQEQQQSTPLQGYLANRAAEERTKQQVLQSHLHKGVVVLGQGSHNNNHSYYDMTGSVPSGVTPIQVPRRPFADHRHHNNGSSGQSSVAMHPVDNASRVREISSSSGYVFTARTNHPTTSNNNNNSRRTPPPPSSRNNNNNNVSPSMAFVRNNGSGRFGSNHGYGHMT